MAHAPHGGDIGDRGNLGNGDDPVLARRRRIARWAEVGQRAGYLLYGVALVLFVAAMVLDLPGALVVGVIVAMAVGSVLLAPAIVVGYGVRAADREDRENEADRIRRQRNRPDRA
jgi:hypothetical protein